jgi:uncharacterized protein (DUF433 family)
MSRWIGRDSFSVVPQAPGQALPTSGHTLEMAPSLWQRYDASMASRNTFLAKQLRVALRRSGWDAGTIAWRARVSRSDMARMLVGDTDMCLNQYESIADHLDLTIQFVPCMADGGAVQATGLVVIDPEVMGGVPVFADSRVPIDNVLSSLDRGIAMDRLVASYPFLTSAHIHAARAFAQFHPRTQPSWPKVDTIVDVVARRLKAGRAPGSGEQVSNPG